MFYSTAPPACSLRINKVGQINIQLPLLTITMVKTDNRYPKRLLAQMYKLYILYFAIFCILPVVIIVAVFPTLSCVAVVCYTIVHVIVYVTFAAVCLRLQ